MFGSYEIVSYFCGVKSFFGAQSVTDLSPIKCAESARTARLSPKMSLTALGGGFVLTFEIRQKADKM